LSPPYNYDRLSAQDASFLAFEDGDTHMHVGATQIFEIGSLASADGGVDFDAYRSATQSVLHRIPRYRQRLEWIPLEGHPVWVDDKDFNLDYHLRHTSLPRPGTERQLKRLSARIMSQPLDRSKPLWEIWVVEGLEGDRFAVISKIHHCMVDGSSGVDLAQILMSTTPEYEIEEAPRYIPRPVPAGSRLLVDEWARRATIPLRVLRGLRAFRRETADLGEELRIRTRALSGLFGMYRSASESPINGEIGPHRRFDWLQMPLEEVKAVRRLLGCTLNDVVLATVTGAVRSFMRERQVDPAGLDFRVSAPVSVRREGERGKLGNRVSAWILELPIGESDRMEQLERIRATTQELKESRQAVGVDMLMQAANWMPSALLALGARASSGPINAIVTNVPGPQFPLFLLGAKLDAMYPQVPLLPNTGLGIALISYDGRLCWGFSADYELVPDLHRFVVLVRGSFDELARLAGAAPSEEAGPPARERRAEASLGSSAEDRGAAAAKPLRPPTPLH